MALTCLYHARALGVKGPPSHTSEGAPREYSHVLKLQMWAVTQMHMGAGGMGDMTNDDMGAISMDVMGGMQHAEEHVDVVSENHGQSRGSCYLSNPD